MSRHVASSSTSWRTRSESPPPHHPYRNSASPYSLRSRSRTPEIPPPAGSPFALINNQCPADNNVPQDLSMESQSLQFSVSNPPEYLESTVYGNQRNIAAPSPLPSPSRSQFHMVTRSRAGSISDDGHRDTSPRLQYLQQSPYAQAAGGSFNTSYVTDGRSDSPSALPEEPMPEVGCPPTSKVHITKVEKWAQKFNKGRVPRLVLKKLEISADQTNSLPASPQPHEESFINYGTVSDTHGPINLTRSEGLSSPASTLLNIPISGLAQTEVAPLDLRSPIMTPVSSPYSTSAGSSAPGQHFSNEVYSYTSTTITKPEFVLSPDSGGFPGRSYEEYRSEVVSPCSVVSNSGYYTPIGSPIPSTVLDSLFETPSVHTVSQQGAQPSSISGGGQDTDVVQSMHTMSLRSSHRRPVAPKSPFEHWTPEKLAGSVVTQRSNSSEDRNGVTGPQPIKFNPNIFFKSLSRSGPSCQESTRSSVLGASEAPSQPSEKLTLHYIKEAPPLPSMPHPSPPLRYQDQQQQPFPTYTPPPFPSLPGRSEPQQLPVRYTPPPSSSLVPMTGQHQLRPLPQTPPPSPLIKNPLEHQIQRPLPYTLPPLFHQREQQQNQQRPLPRTPPPSPLSQQEQQQQPMHYMPPPLPLLSCQQQQQHPILYTPPLSSQLSFQQQQQRPILYTPPPSSPLSFQQQQPQKRPQVPLQPMFLPTPKVQNVFRGVGSRVAENSFSVELANRLEMNYTNRRKLVMNQDGFLMTPFKYLETLTTRMKIEVHVEFFRFVSNNNEVQFRAELYVGGFCGVAHAINRGYSLQLAAAHVLERMRAYFRELKGANYALFPGIQYTKMGDKLIGLTKMYDLGTVNMAYKYNGRKSDPKNPTDVQWRCTCHVKKLTARAYSDSRAMGGNLAARDMYYSYTQPSEAVKHQMKDYFGVGADCPMLRDIHCSIMLNRPSVKKEQWMMKNQVPATQIDAVLHDPTNASRYLMNTNPTFFAKRAGGGRCEKVEDNLTIFQRGLLEALNWMTTSFRHSSLEGARLRRTRGAHKEAQMDVEEEGQELGRELNGEGEHMVRMEDEGPVVEDIEMDV